MLFNLQAQTSLIVFLLSAVVTADELPDSPRVTPLVKVIHEVEPAVVSLFVIPAKDNIVSGSGSIIHASGYVLTNNHVVPLRDGFAMVGTNVPGEQKPIHFRVVGRHPERDLAILKLDGGGPFPTLSPGRSHDLLNGESVVVAGNPGGRGLVFTSGIVSSRMVLAGGPIALVMSRYKTDRRPRFIQFDAASNGGNSGGPLINMEGRQIGVVSNKIYDEQNVGFAIPVDVVYEFVEDILEPELRYLKTTGIQLNRYAIDVEIESIKAASPADAAGLQAGDRIVAVNGQRVMNRIDWFLLLQSVLPTGTRLNLQVQRSDRSLDAHLQPAKLQPEDPVEIAVDSLQPGMAYQLYSGAYENVPDFRQLTADTKGVLKTVNGNDVQADDDTNYALELNGYLKIPKTGHYRLVIVSDDGSLLYLNDRLIVDNDGNHPALGAGKVLYLGKGFHPIRIGYFQGTGKRSLELLIEDVISGNRQDADEESPLTPGKQMSVPEELIWHVPD